MMNAEECVLVSSFILDCKGIKS